MDRTSLRIGTFAQAYGIAVSEMMLNTGDERPAVHDRFEAESNVAERSIPEDVRRVQTALLERYVAMIRRG